MAIVKIIESQNRKNLAIAMIDMESIASQAIIAVDAEIAKAKILGITPRTVVIEQQLNRIRTEQKNIMRQTVTKGGTIGVLAEKAETGEDKFTWQGIGDKKICPDCAFLDGHTRTLNEWLSTNMPGDGQTLCTNNCRCKLVPAPDYIGTALLTGIDKDE